MKTCTGCKKDVPLDRFLFEQRRGRHMARCKDCRTTSQSAWRRARPEYERERYAKDKAGARERHLVRKYGVTLASYDSMLQAQDGKCAICLAPEAAQFKGVFHVDHCHATSAVRGLLCRGCNHMLGSVGDDPAVLRRAIAYLVPQVAAEVIGAYLECRP